MTISGFSRIASSTSSLTRDSDSSSASAGIGSKAAIATVVKACLKRILIISPLFVGFCPRGLDFANAVWPGGPDEGQDVVNLLVGQHVCETRHSAVVFDTLTRQKRRTPQFCVIEEQAVRMMPGVTRLIMRWCWQAPIRAGRSPFRLAFQICAMTRRAVVCVEQRAFLDVGALRLGRAADIRGCTGREPIREGGCCDSDRKGPNEISHVTRIQVVMPDAAWLSMWQWNSQLPGLSAVKAISRDSLPANRIVSRIGPNAPSGRSSRKCIPCRCIACGNTVWFSIFKRTGSFRDRSANGVSVISATSFRAQNLPAWAS